MGKQAERIPVLLVDDHAVVRHALRMLLSSEPDIDVVGEAENGRDAVSLVGRTRPAVVVMDVAMPGLNGATATRAVLRKMPSVKVLALSSHDDDESVDQMMRAGASGYLVKQAAAEDLLKAIREVHRGNAFFSPNIARHLCDRCRREAVIAKKTKATSGLTQRELQVLKLVADGFKNRQIALDLGISIKTVEKHRARMMNKLDIHEIAGLTRHAVLKGLVEAERAQPSAEQAQTA